MRFEQSCQMKEVMQENSYLKQEVDHVKGEYNRLETELVRHIQQNQYNNSQD